MPSDPAGPVESALPSVDLEALAAARALLSAIDRCGCNNDQHAHYCHEARDRARRALARQAAPTGQLQEAGARGTCATGTRGSVPHLKDSYHHCDHWMLAAAPPSAPQEGLAEKGVRTADRGIVGAGRALLKHYDNHGQDNGDCELCEFWLNAPFAPPPSAETARLARLAVQQKEAEDRKLAAMTPAQREAHIQKWAADLAPQLAAAGTEYDRLSSGQPPARPPSPAVDAAPIGAGALKELLARTEETLRGVHADASMWQGKHGDLWGALRTLGRCPSCNALLFDPEDSYAPCAVCAPARAILNWQPAPQAPPEPSPAVTEKERWALALSTHYLAGIECDHAKKLDQARCACSTVTLPWLPSVGAAVESWIAHVKEVIATDPERRPPSGQSAAPGVVLKKGTAPALGRCYGHLGPPSNTNEPHPENGTCFDWRADPLVEQQQSQSPAVSETRELTEEKP